MNSIYVSTTNIRASRIGDAVRRLAELGFTNIELSGGTKFYDSFCDDLIELREKYNLNYRCHNYFPPPEFPFVLNLASKNIEVVEASHDLIVKAVDLSSLLGAGQYGLHAGFRMNPGVSELGEKWRASSLDDYSESLSRFVRELAIAQVYANKKKVELYIENNVCSLANVSNFNGDNPFLLTCVEQVEELKGIVRFNLLLDVAHLKVSSNSLGLDFAEEFNHLIKESDYIHVSDNDGTKDSNKGIRQESELYQLLKYSVLSDKTFTLEIYDGEESIVRSYELLADLIL